MQEFTIRPPNGGGPAGPWAGRCELRPGAPVVGRPGHGRPGRGVAAPAAARASGADAEGDRASDSLQRDAPGSGRAGLPFASGHAREVMEPVSEPRSAGRARPDITVLPDPTLDVSIVVPYYNPGRRLRATVEHMVRVLDASGMTFEIITVSDGSTDGSPFTLDGFPESVVRRISFDTNVGKGHALRAGLGMGRGRYLGFIDADGDISPEFLAPFVAIMQSEEPDIIIGSKRHPDSSVHYPPLRRLYSWGYQRLIHLLFRLNVKDTQVGIKLVSRRVDRRRPPPAAREPLRARPRAPRPGAAPGLHADRRGAGRYRASGSAARSRSRPSGCSSSTRSASSSASPSATSTTGRWRRWPARRRRPVRPAAVVVPGVAGPKSCESAPGRPAPRQDGARHP